MELQAVCLATCPTTRLVFFSFIFVREKQTKQETNKQITNSNATVKMWTIESCLWVLGLLRTVCVSFQLFSVTFCWKNDCWILGLFVVAVGSSDAYIKVFGFNPKLKWFTLLGKSSYHGKCLLTIERRTIFIGQFLLLFHSSFPENNRWLQFLL